MINRKSKIKRETKETQIEICLELDGSGKSDINIGIPFLEHMLEQVAHHGLFNLYINAKGDLDIDYHHTVEDVGITLGQAFTQALTDKTGICRYAHSYVPLDEALSRVVIDYSGRPKLEYNVDFPRALIGNFDVDLILEFFQGFVNHANITLHIDSIRGYNSHHIAESIFKAFGITMRSAIEIDPKKIGILPSTKNVL